MGKPLHLLTHTQDITSRKNEELSRSERLKALSCINRVVTILSGSRVNVETIRRLIDDLQRERPHPECSHVRINFDEREFLSESFSNTEWKLERNIIVKGVNRGAIQFFYAKRITGDDTPPFASDEEELIDAITTSLSAAIERSEAEDQYEDLYENAPDMYVSVDPESGRVDRCNETLLRQTGFTRDEVVGHPIFDRYTTGSVPEAKQAFLSFIETGEVRDAELQLRHKDGSSLDVSLNVTSVRDSRGRIIKSRSSWRDISHRKELEGQLAEEEDNFRVIFDSMPIGWAEHEMIFDDDGEPLDYVFLNINPAFERFTGLTRAMVIGRRVTEVIPGIREADPDLIALYGDVVRSGKQRGFELHFAPLERWYSVTAFRRSGSRFIVMFEDVTERKESDQRILQEETKVRTFLENSSDLMTIVTPSGELQYLNRASVDVFGLPAEELIGRSAFEFIHEDDRKSTRDAFASWLEEGSTNASWENRQVSVDGVIRHMLWTIMPRYSEGELESVWSIARDITQQKKTEEELRRLNESLMASNKELEQFAYVASHDLQEPLRMVASYTQLLAQRYEGQIDEKADKYINYAVDGARRMQRLINDLLTFSRVGTRGRPFEPTNLGGVVSQALRNLQKSIEEQSAEIVVHELPTIYADETQMIQVFQNLISNSIKFHGDTPPRVEVTAEQKGDNWEIMIADNGIGIAPEFHERIFVIFQRLHERGKYDGTGIGLALVKKIVERHGGSIRLESAGGHGTKVFLTLPTLEASQRGNHE